jgi:hypothetical protein
MTDPVLRTVTYKLSEADMSAYERLMRKRRSRVIPEQRSWVSAVIAPLVLGVVLAGASLLVDDASLGFGYVLVAATIAYLAGFFALQYELSRSAKLSARAMFRANPLLYQPRQVTIQDDALAESSPAMSVQFRYAAFTDVEVAEGLVLAWLGTAAATPFPVRAFANPAEADAFAAELRRRIAVASSAAAA